MKNHDLYESMKEEARLILSETKRFQTISEKNPISYEAADLLANLRNRLNAFEHMTDEAGRIMRDEAESHASTPNARSGNHPAASVPVNGPSARQ